MTFSYNGQMYDTYISVGKWSTRDLQFTKDPGLKRAVVNAYYGKKNARKLLEHNELDVVFELALLNARYKDHKREHAPLEAW